MREGFDYSTIVAQEGQTDSLPLFQDRLKREWSKTPENEQKLIELKFK